MCDASDVGTTEPLWFGRSARPVPCLGVQVAESPTNPMRSVETSGPWRSMSVQLSLAVPCGARPCLGPCLVTNPSVGCPDAKCGGAVEEFAVQRVNGLTQTSAYGQVERVVASKAETRVLKQ